VLDFPDCYSLDVADALQDLPEPSGLSIKPASFPNASELAAKPAQRPNTPPPPPTSFSPQKPRTMRKDSIDFPEADPWGSPAMHKNHAHNSSPPKTNGASNGAGNGAREPTRTTSNFTTTSVEGNGTSDQPAGDAPSTPGAGGVWGSYDGASSAPFPNPGESTIGGDGFGDSGGDGGDRPTPNVPSRSFGGGRVTSAGPEENISVALLPEKEGMFMFQHHNYQVSSPRRGSKVVRRYSDFVWLLDCLHKRYPFRQLPLLPPKRVGGS
jgi:sorting nexin-8